MDFTHEEEIIILAYQLQPQEIVNSFQALIEKSGTLTEFENITKIADEFFPNSNIAAAALSYRLSAFINLICDNSLNPRSLGRVDDDGHLTIDLTEDLAATVARQPMYCVDGVPCFDTIGFEEELKLRMDYEGGLPFEFTVNYDNIEKFESWGRVSVDTINSHPIEGSTIIDILDSDLGFECFTLLDKAQARYIASQLCDGDAAAGHSLYERLSAIKDYVKTHTVYDFQFGVPIYHEIHEGPNNIDIELIQYTEELCDAIGQATMIDIHGSLTFLPDSFTNEMLVGFESPLAIIH